MDNIVININSNFSDLTKYTHSNFVYHLDEEIKNIIYIKLGSIELPTTFYNFLSNKQNISFTISDSLNTDSVTIEEGNYTPASIVTKIQAKLDEINTARSKNYNISLDTYNNKITIVESTNPTPSSFSLNFSNNDVGYGSLGKHLGFKDDTYSGTSITAENVINLMDPKYVFLKLNEYDNMLDYYVKNAFAKVIITSGDYDYTIQGKDDFVKKSLVFRSPQNLSRIQIQLVDYRDKIIDLNGSNLTLTLEVGYVYDKKLYEELLNKGIPNGDHRNKFNF